MKMNSLFVYVLLCLGLQACSPSLMWQWAPAEQLNPKIDPEFTKNVDAVYLLREYRFLKVSRWGSGNSYEQQQTHEVIKILTEKGRQAKATEIRVRYPKKGNIVSFEARTIQADATIIPLTPEDVYDDDLVKDKKDGNDWKVRVFAFPQVKVGSVIEYQYTREIPWVNAYDWGYINNSKWPTLKYRLEIMGTKDIRYALTAYNSEVQWKQDTEGKYWKLSWETENLKPSPEGSFRSGRQFYDPWWAFRIKQYAKYNVSADIYRTWDSAFDGRADDLYFDNKEYYAGWKPELSFASCEGQARCKIERIRKHLEETPLKNCKDGWEGRPLKQMAETNWMSNGQYARALWKILKDEKIEALFAMPAGRYWDFWDKDFPAPQELDGNILVYVPEQKNLKAPLWIDPCCPYCKLGEMPVWNRGSDAYLLLAKKGTFDKRAKLKGKWVKVSGKPPIEEVDREEIRVTISSDGGAKISVNDIRHGRRAMNVYHKSFGRTQKEWKDTTVENIGKRIEGADFLRADAGLKCKPDLSLCSRETEYEVKGFATVEGDDLFVPMTFLTSDWSGFFKTKDRKIDIRFSKPHFENDLVHVTVPEGYRLINAIKPKTISDTVFEGKLSIEGTGNSVKLERSLKVKPGIYKASSRKAFQTSTDAFANVRKAVFHFSKAAADNESKKAAE
jgi:hypothetical protein